MDFAKLKALFLNILFPARCLACKKYVEGESALCEECFAKIDVNNAFYCPECNRRLPEAKFVCHPAAKFILAAATSYQDDVARELIHALKYDGLKITLTAIEKFIKDYIGKINLKNIADNSWIIIPIPLHARKERKRGFNQAVLIAEILGRFLNRPILRILEKTKNTPPQVELKNYEERAKNVEGNFQVETETVKNKNIILVDDVFTSGATMREAVKVLKNAGAKKIIAFVIAKA